PPAFVLSQDQTLRLIAGVSLSISLTISSRRLRGLTSFFRTLHFLLLQMKSIDEVSFAFSLFFLSWCRCAFCGDVPFRSATGASIS
ncbi:MAG: hypothetical protein RRY12_11260, partial [Cloacibacillus sp.]